MHWYMASIVLKSVPIAPRKPLAWVELSHLTLTIKYPWLLPPQVSTSIEHTVESQGSIEPCRALNMSQCNRLDMLLLSTVMDALLHDCWLVCIQSFPQPFSQDKAMCSLSLKKKVLPCNRWELPTGKLLTHGHRSHVTAVAEAFQLEFVLSTQACLPVSSLEFLDRGPRITGPMWSLISHPTQKESLWQMFLSRLFLFLTTLNIPD